MLKDATTSALMKRVRKILPASRPHWVGNGFNVYPVFAGLAFTNELSPWLMFDYAAPKEFPPTSQRLGVGQHPHRGFETVTIAFQGGACLVLAFDGHVVVLFAVTKEYRRSGRAAGRHVRKEVPASHARDAR